jgi:hypothetical protein
MKSLFTNWLPKKPSPPETDWEAKYKKAITDLADKSLALCDTQAELRATESLLINAENERDAFRPDALAMRRKRRMDRDRKAAKKEGGNV